MASPSEDFRAALLRARERRAPLARSADTRCYRLVNADADGFPGLTLDRFEDVGILSVYSDAATAQAEAHAELFLETLGLRTLYLKQRPREARTVVPTELASETPLRGPAAPDLTVKEGGHDFHIRPGAGLAVGLYLDMRDTRAWLEANARDRTVLNAFSYTCAFGIYATAGGASRVLNIDLSRKSLDWGAENARLNGQPADVRDHLAGDVFEWLERLGKKGERFDVVVLDPPSFAKGKKGKRGTFSAATDYPELVSLATRVTSPGGVLLACCNLAKLTPERFHAQVEQGVTAVDRRVVRTQRLGPSPADFPAVPGEPPALKVLACTLT